MNKALIITITILSLALLFYFQNDVYVKYSDINENRSSYSCLPYTGSSFVNDACYNSSNQKMLLKLGDTSYTFCNVPASVWNEFKSSESMGGYFNKKIKGRYDC